MSGHSKWSTIKRKKGALDQKRGKLFTRCIHEVTIATREGGGGDPDGNPRLRFAIDKAKSVNVPNDTIERAIKRATGELTDGEQTFELMYEGYGPGGAAVLVEVVTNNKNRTVSEIRHAFSRNGGSLGETGCVQWMFEKKGLIVIKKEHATEEKLFDKALEAGANDVIDADEVWDITTDHKNIHEVRAILANEFELELAEVQQLPKTRVQVEGKEADQMIKLIELLDDLDDVLNVYCNADIVEK